MNETLRLSKDIENTLRAACGRIRRILAVRGACTTLAVFAGATLGVMAIDAMVTIFSSWIRWLLWCAVVAATGWTAFVALVRPLRRFFSLAEIAALIERNHPELEERLSTAVELAQEREAAAYASPELVAAVAHAAEEDVGRVSPRREFTARTILPRLWTVLGAVLVLGLLFAVFPSATSRLVVRALVPSAEVDNVYAHALRVMPGDRVVLAGSSVEISVAVDEGFPARAFVRTSVGGRAETSERMTRASAADEPARYAFVYPCVTESLDYRIHCGSALTRAYRIEAVPAPTYADRRITVEHPAYAGRPADTYANRADIVALAGSKVTVSVRPSRPDVSGALAFADGRRLAGVARDGRLEFAFELKPDGAGSWRGEVFDSHGFSNTVETASVEVVKDAPPEVTLVSPEEREVKLPRTGVLPLEVAAKDDFRIVRRAIEICVGAGEWTELRELGSDAETLAVSSLPLGNATSFRVRVCAADNLPPELGGPNVGRSEEVLVTLAARDGKSLARQSLAAEIAGAKKAAEEIRRHVEKAARQTEALGDLAREDGKRGTAKRNLAAAKNELTNAEGLLSDLVRQLEDGRLEAAAETFRDVLEKNVVPLRQDLEDVASAESPAEQGKAGAEAAKEGKRAKEAADEAVRRLDALAKKAEEMQRLQDLAEREQALAEAAESGEMSPSEIAKAEKDLAEDLRREIAAERSQNLEGEKKTAERLQQRADDLAQRQDEIRGQSGEGQKAAEKKLSEDLRRLEKETSDLRSNIESKTGGLDADPNETSESVRDAQQAAKTASQEAQAASDAMKRDELPAAEKNMGAVSEALKKASEGLSEVQSRIDSKNRENAGNVDKMEAARKTVGEAQAAAEAQAAQDAQNAPNQKSDQNQQGSQDAQNQKSDKSQQGSQDAKSNPMTQALKRAAEALQQMAREQMEQAGLSPESFDAEDGEDSDSEEDSDSGEDSDSESDEDSKSIQDTDNKEGKGPPSKWASSAKSKNKAGKGHSRNKRERLRQRLPLRAPESDENADWVRMKGESAREAEDAFDDVPAEYRSLVRDYFKALNEGGGK